MSHVLTFQSPRHEHKGDPNQDNGLTKKIRKTYPMILCHIIELTPKTYSHQKEPCNNRGCLNYGKVGKHFALCEGRWGLKCDHVKGYDGMVVSN